VGNLDLALGALAAVWLAMLVGAVIRIIWIMSIEETMRK
jgi:hypothetical protein